MGGGLLHSLLLLAGLRLVLPAFPPERAWARVLAIAVLEVYVLRYFAWRVTATAPELALTATSLWQWLFLLVEALSTAFVCWSAFGLVRRSDHSALADVREAMLRAQPRPRSVSVLIPTVNEPVEVLEATIRAAVRIDYPDYEVLVLDDDKGGQTGRVHAWLPYLCARYGVRYLRRPTSEHAKAGNLNFGLAQSTGAVILVLDADFRATRNILWRLVGLLDERVALVQTPQHYYSSDPIQHNLGGMRAWTEEQRHFFDVVLPARDAWGNAVCVGTGFVVRREALGPGGFEIGCLSEDVYGGYALMSRGLRVLYLNEPLAMGAAADSVPEYIRQRVRWCQGILQAVFLPYGPLRASGLRLVDRLFYLEMPLYWVSQFGFLGLVLLAPLIYFWTGVPAFDASLEAAAFRVLPRIVASSAVMYWLSGGRVMPILTELKKLVGVVYILGAIASLLTNPRGKPFVPTLKGEKRDRLVVNWDVGLPFVVYAVFLLVGMLWALVSHAGHVRWDEYLPVNMLFGLYTVTMAVLCALAAIDWPKDTLTPDYRQVLGGRWRSALLALVRGVSSGGPTFANGHGAPRAIEATPAGLRACPRPESASPLIGAVGEHPSRIVRDQQPTGRGKPDPDYRSLVEQGVDTTSSGVPPGATGRALEQPDSRCSIPAS